jgi:heptosyltransferase-2
MKIGFFRWFDRIIGSLLILFFWPASLFFPKFRGEPKRILVIKLWAVGESVLTLPLIQSLKKKYPKASITVLVRDRIRDVFSGQKLISEVCSAEFFPLLRMLAMFRRYDLVFDCEPYLNESALLSFWLGKRRIGFSHGLRSLLYTDRVKYNDEQHVVLAYMDLGKVLGIEEVPKKLVPLATGRTAESKIKRLFNEWGIKNTDRIVCIVPGAAESAKSRMWPAEKFARVADALVREFLVKIIINGTKDERKICEAVREKMHYNAIISAGDTNIKELAVLLKKCALTITNDTGPVHLSPAMGTPTIGLFCPNTPVRFAPYGQGNDFVYKPVLPKPCINVHKGQVPECKNHKHMSLIRVDDVLQKARRLLNAGNH